MKKSVLSVDLGGTHVAYATVDSSGAVSNRGKLRTREFATFHDMLAALRQATSGLEFDAVGFCAPAVDSNGVITGAVDLPWPSPIPLASETASVFGVPCTACNDANAAAMGEALFGEARGLDNFIVLTLGTGIGSGIVADGNLLLGNRGLAGELGHTLIRRGDDARICACGRSGCLETYCSAGGVVRTALELLRGNPEVESSMRDSGDSLSSKKVADAALDGDELALRTFEITGRILGEACADFAACFSPKVIILFGGVTGAGKLLLNPAREAFESNLLYIYKNDVRLVISSLPGDDAAILGAAASALKNLK